MKLEYDISQKKYFNSSMSLYIVLFMFIFIQCIIMSFFMITQFAMLKFLNIVLIITIIVVGVMAIFICVNNIKQRNDKISIKEQGTKVSANIIETSTIYKRTGRYGSIHVYCFTVIYDNDTKKSVIEFLLDNDAYELLKLLLNPYPINEEVRIPIDIYVYKNEVYADLESVDFTKVERYDECKKVIDSMYHKE